MSKNNPINIFYAHASSGTTEHIYEKLCEKISNLKHVKIFDPQDEIGAINLDDTMFDQIKNADLVIADITPDDYKIEKDLNDVIIKKTPILNKHVMTELGFAFDTHHKSQIFLMYDGFKFDTADVDIPIFYKTKNYHKYKTAEDSTIDSLYEDIKLKINEIRKEVMDKNLLIVKYYFDNKIFECLKMATCSEISSIDVLVNKETRSAKIYIYNSIDNICGIIDVDTKKLLTSKKSKPYDLSNNSDLSNELRHIQLMCK